MNHKEAVKAKLAFLRKEKSFLQSGIAVLQTKIDRLYSYAHEHEEEIEEMDGDLTAIEVEITKYEKHKK